MKNRKWLKILLVLLAVVIMGVVFSCQSKPSENTSDQEEVVIVDEGDRVLSADNTESDDFQMPETSVEAETTIPVTSDNRLCVHVCGSVKKPGVYYLADGARVHEAIEAAGGLTKNAAQDFMNLAGKVSDGEKIYVPSVSEAEDQTIPLQEAKTEAETQDEMINLNTATLEELVTLPGIGKTKAKEILKYREEAGAFTDIKDIMNVSGIGESSFEKIKDQIKV